MSERLFCFAGAIPFVKCLSERVWVGVGEFSENYHIKRSNARLHKQEFFQTSANFLPNCKGQWFVSSACSRDQKWLFLNLQKKEIFCSTNYAFFFPCPPHLADLNIALKTHSDAFLPFKIYLWCDIFGYQILYWRISNQECLGVKNLYDLLKMWLHNDDVECHK